MRLLHTSDWHIGISDGNRLLLEDQRSFINQICDIVKEKKVDGIMISGDVYDRPVVNSECIKLYDEAMIKLCLEKKVPVYMIAGNHDSAERLSTCNELLKAANLYIVGNTERDLYKIEYPTTDIYFLPWISEEKVRSLFPEKKDEINSLEDAYMVILNNAREKLNKSKFNVIISHSYITNSETSTSDKAAEIGFACSVSSQVFDGFDYVALGHLHKPQDITKNIRYSGTPIAYSFGVEESQEKSVTIIDTETKERELVSIKPLHKRTTIKGTLDEIINNNYDENTINGYVKVEITDVYAGLEVLNRIRTKFPNVFEISGKSFENDNIKQTIKLEDFKKIEHNPLEVFKSYIKEQYGKECDEHLESLFKDTLDNMEENI